MTRNGIEAGKNAKKMQSNNAVQKNENNHEPLLTNTDKVEIQAASNKSSQCNHEPKALAQSTEEKLRKHEKLTQPCGPKNTCILRLVSSFLCLFVVWGILFTLLNREALPGGKLLVLIFLVAASYLLGDIFKLFGIASLLGMLICGIIIRNVGLFFDTKNAEVYTDVIATTRQVALTCILITAGLELDAKSLRKVSFVVLELSFIPCIFEAIGVAVFCKVILGYDWTWGLLVGFIMGAVSPAIVVPSLLKLQKSGYDSNNKISTIVIAAASFDDIVAIAGFGVFFGLIFNKGSITEKLLRAPIEIVLGIICGVSWGVLSAWVPHKLDKHLVAKRVFMVGGGGLFFVLGSKLIDYDGAGPLTCIISAFVACIGWKWQGWSHSYNPVAEVFSSLWLVLQPALFGLIGAEIDLSVIQFSQLLNGVIIIIGGLIFRAAACSLVLLTADVNYKELIFINVAWIPKATVQAALGSLALDQAKSMKTIVEEQVRFGEMTLMISVLSILITAPIGAIFISLLGKRLLKRDVAVTSVGSNIA